MSDDLTVSEFGHVCESCINEDLISKEISEAGIVTTCTYCDTEDVTCVTIEWLGDRIDERYTEIIAFGDYAPEFESDNDRVNMVQEGDSPSLIIGELLEVSDDEIAQDLVSYLASRHEFGVHRDGETDWYDETSCYQVSVPTSERYKYAWETFCTSLKHERRFFSAGAAEILDEIFGPILAGTNRLFSAAVRTIGPDSEDRFVFRGRPANDDRTRKSIYSAPIRELGAPPPSIATAGRMNAHGISVFYGSMDPKTCVAELRAPVAGQVVVGKFEIIRPLRILDLTKLRQIQNDLSVFDPSYLDVHDYAKFLRGFHQEIKKPIIPGRELLDYLPTQVVAEYLWTRAEGAVDGLIFGSSLLSGDHTNIVLFPSALNVEGRAEEVPSEIRDIGQYGGGSSDDDDYDPDFWEVVWYKDATPKEAEPANEGVEDAGFPTFSDVFGDIDDVPPLEPSLRFHRNSLASVRVQQITYDIATSSVNYQRARSEGDPPDPF